MEISKQLKRPILRYHGGKWMLAKWIISHFPDHRVYVEPFGGAASVLLRKERSYCEVYNDLDSEIVSLFKVVREQGEELIKLLENTPFARDEFKAAYEFADCPLENARRTIIRSFMGFGSAAVTGQATGFRSGSHRSGTTPAKDWLNYPYGLQKIMQRLKGVTIENKNAIALMSQHDAEDTLHYLDPPYVWSTRVKRGNRKSYRNEMEDADHEELLNNVKQLKGKVIISGYRNHIYDRHLKDWHSVDRKTFADGAKKRTETLWMNFNN